MSVQMTNMYINPDLTVMTKTTRMWEKTKTGEMWQPSEQLEPIPAEISLLDLPNVALISRPHSCVTLVHTI